MALWKEKGIIKSQEQKQLLFCASLVQVASQGSADLHVDPHYQAESCSSTFFFFLPPSTIIIDLFASLVARKKQPTGLSKSRSSPSNRHLDDTVSWHSLDICSSLGTENESATDDISHYNKPVTAARTISSAPYFTGVETNVSWSGADGLGKHCCPSGNDKTTKDKNRVLNVANEQTPCSVFKVPVHESSHHELQKFKRNMKIT